MQPRIVSARITAMPKRFTDPMPEVYVRVDNSAEEIRLFDYYPDEISFSAREFIGLTVAEARRLKYTKDLAYLQS